MKKIFCILMLFSSLFMLNNVNCAQLEESKLYETRMMEKHITNEPSLPVPTRGTTSYNQWIVTVKGYLENHYDQKIEKVLETSNDITFIFAEKENKYQDGIEKIVYNKITATNKVQSKVTYEYSWSKVHAMDSTSVLDYVEVGVFLVNVFGDVSKPVSFVLDVVSKMISYTFNHLPLRAETRVQAKVHIKTGSYNVSSGTQDVWWPNVQIGRCEYWFNYYVYQPEYEGGPETTITYINDPTKGTKCDEEIVANHYYDENWIRNKSIELGDKGKGDLYRDVPPITKRG